MYHYYYLPPVSLLPAHSQNKIIYTDYSGGNIADFLTRGGLSCTCVGNHPGAAVDLYTFRINDYYSLSKLSKLLPPLEMMLGATVKSATNTPAGTFGIEVQRRQRQNVYFADCVHAERWQKSSRAAALLGVAGAGTVTALNIDNAPHVLIAGQTGSGKSVLMNTIICSLLLKNDPNDAEMVFIDPKKVEFSHFANLPHVKKYGMITSAENALDVLQHMCDRMEKRYSNMIKNGSKEFTGKKAYIFIDELADLMLNSGKLKKQIETCIVRIAQKGRAAGFHLIIATQSPRTSVITGLISANIPVKIALTVSNTRESVIVLGHKGAEQLTGKGDCVLKTPLAGETRLQAAYLTEREIDAVVDYWTQQAPPKTFFQALKRLFHI